MLSHLTRIVRWLKVVFFLIIIKKNLKFTWGPTRYAVGGAPKREEVENTGSNRVINHMKQDFELKPKQGGRPKSTDCFCSLKEKNNALKHSFSVNISLAGTGKRSGQW